MPTALTALTNTALSVQSSPTTLYGWSIYNPSDAVAYIQLFNLAVGDVIVGTSTPKWVIPVLQGGVVFMAFDGGEGIDFPIALSYAATTSATGSGAPSFDVEIQLIVQ